MKKHNLNIIKILLCAAFMVVAITSRAQAPRTGYFLEGNIYSYRLNPALDSQRGHVSIPLLGGISVTTKGNIGLGTFLYPSPHNNNEMITFMHGAVSTEDFLGSLDDDNTIGMNMDFTLLSLGFHAFGGFNTLDVSLRSEVGMNIPFGMFKFMKDMGSEDFSFSNFGIQTKNYADISLGHSHDVTKDLRIGGRVKVLLGFAYAKAEFEKMNLSARRDKWEIAAKGHADIALGGMFTSDDDNVVTGYENIGIGVQGIGGGLDLGAAYDFSDILTDGLIVSASLTDLGWISWDKSAYAAIEPESSYIFDGFQNISVDGDDSSFDDQLESISDDLEDFFTLEDRGMRSVKTSLGAKFNLGVEYVMPFYKRMSVGALYTHSFDDIMPYDMASLMLNISPLNCLDLAASATVSTYGANFGAMLNLHCTGFNVFVASDCFLGKVSKQFIPIDNMNANVQLGVNIALGKHEKE